MSAEERRNNLLEQLSIVETICSIDEFEPKLREKIWWIHIIGNESVALCEDARIAVVNALKTWASIVPQERV